MNRPSLIKGIRLLVLSLGLGLIMGLIGTLFLSALDWVTMIRTQAPWLLIGLPFFGALTAYAYHHYGKNSHKGNALIIDSIHEESEVPFRMAILTFFFSVGTHLFGGSAGREGTGVQIGGALSHKLSDLFKLDRQDRRILTMAGISAGFAAVFGTPLTGTFFGMEVAFIGKLSLEALFPCALSAYSAALMTHWLGIQHSVYVIQSIPSWSIRLVMVLIGASVLFGLSGRFFGQATHWLKKRISIITLASWQKAFLGGALIAGLMMGLGWTRYGGLSLWLIQAGFKGTIQWFDPILKAFFTILTLGFGYQGGEVTPLFGIGASLGGFIGQLTQIEPSLLAALGLITVFGSAANTPLATLMLGIELFGTPAIPFYLIAILISYLVGGHHGIYPTQRIHLSKRHPKDKGKKLEELHR